MPTTIKTQTSEEKFKELLQAAMDAGEDTFDIPYVIGLFTAAIEADAAKLLVTERDLQIANSQYKEAFSAWDKERTEFGRVNRELIEIIRRARELMLLMNGMTEPRREQTRKYEVFKLCHDAVNGSTGAN